jgi:hypothetical protein
VTKPSTPITQLKLCLASKKHCGLLHPAELDATRQAASAHTHAPWQRSINFQSSQQLQKHLAKPLCSHPAHVITHQLGPGHTLLIWRSTSCCIPCAALQAQQAPRTLHKCKPCTAESLAHLHHFSAMLCEESDAKKAASQSVLSLHLPYAKKKFVPALNPSPSVTLVYCTLTAQLHIMARQQLLPLHTAVHQLLQPACIAAGRAAAAAATRKIPLTAAAAALLGGVLAQGHAQHTRQL